MTVMVVEGDGDGDGGDDSDGGCQEGQYGSYRYMGRSQEPPLRGLTPPSERLTYA